jgi:small subunit ribosomal protein S2
VLGAGDAPHDFGCQVFVFRHFTRSPAVWRELRACGPALLASQPGWLLYDYAGSFLLMADTTELVPELLEAGVHFGHQTKRWNPKMRPYIFEQKNQIYIINLDETVRQLRRATEFLQEVTRRGGKILFVGCKKQAQEAVKEAALACGQFYVNQRWLGGTLTNLTTIRKSIGRLKYIEQIEQSPEYRKMGKQEIAALNREGAKLRRNLDGILDMAQLPDALVIVDTTREQNAVNEARRLNIPTVAIVDTNADPDIIDYPIAGNDDAIRAIRVVLQKLVDAIVSARADSPVAGQAEMAGVSA